MELSKTQSFIENLLKNMPSEWVNLTTHRLDIYDESLAKTQFLKQFVNLFVKNEISADALQSLPTAYDYIRLGHPLSCILEWAIAKTLNLDAHNTIAFSSVSMPLLAILRKNKLDAKKTIIAYQEKLPEFFNTDIVSNIYGYNFDLKHIDDIDNSNEIDASVVYISEQEKLYNFSTKYNTDFHINFHPNLGSILLVKGENNEDYISAIQHVRRRESIAMTPNNCLKVLTHFSRNSAIAIEKIDNSKNENFVGNCVREITGTKSKVLVASSGLSMQYAIMMGLVHDAKEKHKGKAIKFIVPPNCYGGTNDQARRVAASVNNVEVVDLPVDGGNEMAHGIDLVLDGIAKADAIPYIIAEIPTNPRVEIPDLLKLKEVLAKKRTTANGDTAIDPVFILDQTFCPNVHFLGDDEVLSGSKAISYVSGSKFPSGGQCTAGYCVGNSKTDDLIDKVELHLSLCDNAATKDQTDILAKQLPSMNQRIADAYKNTREFVNFISETLPTAKINFVSEDLAKHGFTPSVFSLDLPTKGNTDEEKETYKRALNLKLINLMIDEIPHESKYCVSYGQLKGCYWTIPATSTQGTTKEDDKDYIARVALSGNMNMELHKQVFSDFVKSID